MEPGGSMAHSQGLSNNSYPEPKQTQFPALIHISSRYTLMLSSHLRLGLPKGLFPIGLPVKILKTLLPSSTEAGINKLNPRGKPWNTGTGIEEVKKKKLMMETDLNLWNKILATAVKEKREYLENVAWIEWEDVRSIWYCQTKTIMSLKLGDKNNPLGDKKKHRILNKL